MIDQQIEQGAEQEISQAQADDVQGALAQEPQSVAIQSMGQQVCTKHKDCLGMQAEFAVNADEDDDQQQPQLFTDGDEQDQFILDVDDADSQQFSFNAEQSARLPQSKQVDSYSFITMQIPDDYVIDQETQDALDIVIGQNLDAFVKLVMQSNNNIVSKQVCRACGMHALFSSVQHHKPLDADDIRMVQKLLANLYRFINKTKKLNRNLELVTPEQYGALEYLHKTQAAKDDVKLQARRATTAAALKKLQNIKYNK